MITKEEMDAMIKEGLERLGVGDQGFKKRCQELDDLIEEMRARNREEKAGKAISAREQGLPKKISQRDDVKLLDDLGEIRHLLEKASNSLDSFQCRYKLVYKIEDDRETQKWFFEQRRDMELGISIISDYIITACEKIHKIEKERS